MSDIQTLDHTNLTARMDDVSTAGSEYLVSPTDGKIEEIQSVLGGAIATSDAGITVEIDGVAVTGGAITIATAASAAGDVDSAKPTGNNIVQKGSVIEIITDGASTNAVPAGFTIDIKKTTH